MIRIEAAVVVAVDVKKIAGNHGNIIWKARLRDAEIVQFDAVVLSERSRKGVNCSDAMAYGSIVSG